MKTQGNTHGEESIQPKNQARLNYCLAREPMFSFVTDSDIVPGYRTDHSGVTLKLKLQELERGRSY